MQHTLPETASRQSVAAVTGAERREAVELANFAMARHNKLSRGNLKSMSVVNGNDDGSWWHVL